MKSIFSASMKLSTIPSFEENFEQLSMNSRIEEAKFEPKPTFEKTINDIKANNLKSITSIDMNVSAITPNKPYSSPEHLKSDIITWILIQSPGKPSQFTNNLSSMHSKGNTQLQLENCGFLLDQSYIYYFLVRQHQVSSREKTQRDSSLLQKNNSSSINSTNIKCQTKKCLKSVSFALQQYRGGKTISKCERAESFKRKLRALLYYIQKTTYNRINCKSLRVLIVHFYRLVLFHT